MKLELTDTEAIKVAMKAAQQYIRSLGDRPLDIVACMAAESNAIEQVYKGMVKRRLVNRFLTQDDQKIIGAQFARISKELEEMTKKKDMLSKRTHKTLAICSSTAAARLNGLLEHSGISYRIICQKYRAKVYVTLASESSMILHFRYKDMMGKNLDDLVPSLQKLNALVAKKEK